MQQGPHHGPSFRMSSHGRVCAEPMQTSIVPWCRSCSLGEQSKSIADTNVQWICAADSRSQRFGPRSAHILLSSGESGVRDRSGIATRSPRRRHQDHLAHSRQGNADRPNDPLLQSKHFSAIPEARLKPKPLIEDPSAQLQSRECRHAYICTSDTSSLRVVPQLSS
jgi:hypothetical protein